MKNSLTNYTKIAVLVSLVSLFIACSGSGQQGDLKVGNWGPQSMTLGNIPNEQPNGYLGIWIRVRGTEGIGEVKVLFDGQPFPGYVERKSISTAIPPEQLTKPGKKKIVIQQVSTGKTFPVGTFIIRFHQ